MYPAYVSLELVDSVAAIGIVTASVVVGTTVTPQCLEASLLAIQPSLVAPCCCSVLLVLTLSSWSVLHHTCVCHQCIALSCSIWLHC